jgi:thiamine biosynthesis lipoprotein
MRIPRFLLTVAVAALAMGAVATLRWDPAASAAGSPPRAPAAAPRSVSYPVRAMGTYVNVTLVTPDSAASLEQARAAHAAIRLVDSLMSNWTTTSEIARLNRVADSIATPVEPHTFAVLARSLRLWRESDGAFDITVEPLVRAWGFIGGPKRVPSEAEVREAFAKVGAGDVVLDSVGHTVRFRRPGMRVDLGGIAKGYAVDLAMAALRAHGVENALVDASGNMMAVGGPYWHPAETPPSWRIGLRDPRDKLGRYHFARVQLTQEGISTSANYEQFVAQDGKNYGHILDPRTGRPAEGLLAVTVVAANATTTDAWDTPLFVLGLDAGRRKALQRTDLHAILVAPGNSNAPDTVWVEEELMGRFWLEPAARSRFVLRFF